MEKKETLMSPQRHGVIVGGYMIRITALFAVKHVKTLVEKIILQPYVVVESVEVLIRLGASRLSIKRLVLATIQMKYMWLATLQLSRSMMNNS